VTVQSSRTCPRCGATARYRACPTCALRFFCSTCGHQYEDPLRGRVCPFCGAAVEQPSWEPGEAAEPATARDYQAPPAAPPAAAPAGSRGPLAPLPYVVEATAQRDAPGVLRAAAAQYAAALLASLRGEAARPVLTAALAESGDQPSNAELLLLRAHAAELDEEPGDAIHDLLEATTAAHEFLPGVADRLHDLLDRADDPEPRRFLLESWAWDANGDGAPSHDVSLLHVHAAVLEDDVERASDALRRCVEPSSDGAAAGRASGLLHALRATPVIDGRRPLVLAELLRLAGEPDASLAEVDRALSIGLPDDGSGSPEAPALALRVELLDTLGRRDDAAKPYFEAGRAYYWRDDFDRAAQLLREAAGRLPDDPDPRWILADTLRLQAWRSTPPNPHLVREAVDVWEEGWRIARRVEIPGWAMQVRALLAEDLSNVDASDGRLHILAAVAALEDGVALEVEAAEWVMLARFHRSLGHYAVAFDTLRHAFDLVPEKEQDADTLFEHAWLAMATAAPDAADRVEQFIRHESAADWARGFLLAWSGRPSAGIEPLERAVRVEPDDIDTWWYLGRTLQLTGKHERARECFEKVWSLWGQLADDGAPGDQTSIADVFHVADACYRLGDYLGSVQLLEGLAARLEHRLDEPSDVFGLLALDRLALGDVAGTETALARTLDELRLPIDADFLARDLTDLAAKLARDGSRIADAQVAREMIERASAASEHLRGRSYDREAAVAELQRTLRQPDPSGVAAVACHATLARLLLELGRHDEAEDAALKLLRRRPTSPAGAVCLSDAVIATSDQLVRAGRAELARPRLEAALEHIPQHDRQLVGNLLARVALVAAWAGAERDAQHALSQAHEAFLASGRDGTVATVRIWSGALGNPRTYWRLRHAIADDSELAHIADLCLAAMLRLDESDDEAAAWPDVRPIVELAKDLVPEDTGPEGPMLGAYIPEMRRRVVESITGPLLGDTTDWLPGVRVRSNAAMPRGRFRIKLNEIPRCQRDVPAGMVFCHASSDQVRPHLPEDTAVLPALDPVTRRDATWVASLHTEVLEAAGLRVWRDPLQFVFAELERQVRRNLDAYLTLDQVESLRDQWKAQLGDDAELAPLDLERLAAMVRLLVRDGAPVRDGISVMRAAAASGSVDDAVRDYRLATADVLPGNDDDTVRIAVPSKLAALSSATARGTSPNPGDVFEALAELRATLADQPARVALVATDDAARRIVRTYTAGEFPDVPVLSDQEMRNTKASPTLSAKGPRTVGD
jgi:tetratricopeptide (TPR) repeat protein